MKKTPSLLHRTATRWLALTGMILATASAAVPPLQSETPPAPPNETSFMKGRRFAATDYTSGKVSIVEADGKVSWTHPAKLSNDLWILPGGNLLFGTGNGAKEVSPRDNAVKFSYAADKIEVYAAQRLPNGNTFIGECSTGKLQEVAPDGKIVRTV